MICLADRCQVTRRTMDPNLALRRNRNAPCERERRYRSTSAADYYILNNCGEKRQQIPALPVVRLCALLRRRCRNLWRWHGCVPSMIGCVHESLPAVSIDWLWSKCCYAMRACVVRYSITDNITIDAYIHSQAHTPIVTYVTIGRRIRLFRTCWN